MDWMKVLKEYGFPTLVAIGLGLLLRQQMADAAKERADHTFILVDQLSSMRHACDPKAP